MFNVFSLRSPRCVFFAFLAVKRILLRLNKSKYISVIPDFSAFLLYEPKSGNREQA